MNVFDNFQCELEPGGVKAVKKEHRRSDAMSFVHPDEIRVIQGFNVRLHDDAYSEHLRSLADSMRQEGFKIDKPITCFIRKTSSGADDICVTDGHSRLAAVKLANEGGAGIDAIPVIFLPKTVNMADLTADLVRSNSGRPLTTFETAIVVKRLVTMEFDEDEIAERLSFTTVYIGDLMLLSAASKPVVNLIVAGKISSSTAIEAIKKYGQAKAEDVLKRMVEKAALAGKKKATSASLPGVALTRAVRKAAPKLYESVQLVKVDPGYAGLSEATRDLLDVIVADLAEFAPEADAAVSGDS